MKRMIPSSKLTVKNDKLTAMEGIYDAEGNQIIADGGSLVAGNPEVPEGTSPTELSGLSVQNDSTKVYYKITHSPVVEANPVVPEGITPTALSGLKVDSSYFSIESGGSGTQKYAHFLDVKTGETFNIIMVISEESSAYTTSTFALWLYNNSYTSTSAYFKSVLGSGPSVKAGSGSGTGKVNITSIRGVFSSDGSTLTSYGTTDTISYNSDSQNLGVNNASGASSLATTIYGDTIVAL